MRVALQNGVDTIEHGAEPTAEIIQLFKQRGASLVTTIYPVMFFTFIDPAITHATEDTIGTIEAGKCADLIVTKNKRSRHCFRWGEDLT